MRFVDIDKVKKDLAEEKGYWSAEEFAEACENATFYSTIDDFMQEHGEEIEMICFAPTPERVGSWECIDDDGGVYRCTACGDEWYLEAGTPEENNMHFCPHCGACMDAAEDADKDDGGDDQDGEDDGSGIGQAFSPD